MAEKLEEKEEANKKFENQLERVEALKVEVQNELTIREQLIKDQAAKLETIAEEHSRKLTEKEKEIIEQGKKLEEKEKLAEDAQKKQDETVAEMADLKKKIAEHDKLMAEKDKKIEEMKKMVAAGGCGECTMM